MWSTVTQSQMANYELGATGNLIKWVREIQGLCSAVTYQNILHLDSFCNQKQQVLNAN